MHIPPQAIATVALPATVKSLTEQANLIVHARITSQWTPKQRGAQGEIYTHSSLEVIEVWRGRADGPLVLVQLGGELDGTRLKVHGDAEFKVGDEVVLFLTSTSQMVASPQGRASKVHLISLAQGAFFVERTAADQAVIKQRLEDLTFYSAPERGQPVMIKADQAQHPQQFKSLEALKAEVLK